MKRTRTSKPVLYLTAVLVFAVFFAFLAVTGSGASDALAVNYSDSYFEIRTDADLAELSALSDFDDNDFSGKTVLLLSDVNAPSSGKVFKKFYGTFRGNGFSVKNLKNSFFGEVGSGATVSDLNLFASNAAGHVVADNNRGSISDVSVFGTLRDSAVQYNYGTLARINVFADVSGSTAFLCSENLGSITACFLNGRFAPAASGLTNIGLFTKTASASATLTGCAFDGVLDYDSALTVYPFGKAGVITDTCVRISCTTVSTFDTTVNVEPDRAPIIKSCFYTLNGSLYTVFDASGTLGSNMSNLGGNFYRVNGMTVNTTLFGTSGDYGQEFVLRNMTDVKKLVFASVSSAETGFYAKLGADIFGDGFTSGAGTPVYGVLKGIVSANGKIIANTSFQPFGGEIDSAAVSVVSGFGGDGYVDDSLTTVAGDFSLVTGTGSISDPYVVKTPEGLAGLLGNASANIEGKYAIVTENLIINSVAAHNRTLGAPDVNLDIDFLGHCTVNAHTTVFGTVNGKVKNLDVTLSARSEQASGVCSTLNGVLSRINLYGTGTVTSGMCTENNGRIEYCHNGLAATDALCATGTGVAENCTSIAADGFTGGTVTARYCVMPGFSVGNGLTYDASDYNTLKSNGFDTVNTFGYPAGGSETAPVIKKAGGTYRVLATETVTLYDTTLGFGGLEYDGTGEAKQDVEDFIVDSVPTDIGLIVTFEWKYNGSDFTGTRLLNAGRYSVTVTLGGANYITESRKMTDITVAQADFAGGMTRGDFVNDTYTYRGEVISDEPDPGNKSALTDAGYSFDYRVTRTVNYVTSPATLKDAGTYKQTLTATSVNYKTLTLERTLTVAPASLTLTVMDQTATYGTALDLSTLTESDLTMSGAVGEDAEKSAKTLIEESGYTFLSYFTAPGYSALSGVNEDGYTLNYTLARTENYNITVNAGKIYVEPAMMDITFEDAEYDYDGTAKSILAVGVPEGAEADYGDTNGKVDADTYTVAVTITHVNYVTYTGEATLTINKAELPLTVTPLVERPFGYLFDANDFTFTYDEDALAERDRGNFEELTDGILFDMQLETEDDPLTTKDYYVGMNIDGTMANYRFTVNKGILRIGKAYLYDYYPSDLFDDVTEPYDGTEKDYELPSDVFEEVEIDIEYDITRKKKPNGPSTVVTEIKETGIYTVTATVTPKNGFEDYFEETVYERTITVTKISTSIEFGQSEYVFTYGDREDFAEETFAEATYTYVTNNITGTVTVVFRNSLGGIAHEIKNKGTYTVVAEYAGDENYEYAKAEATIKVKQREVYLSVREGYTYSASPVVPDADISYEGDFEGTLTRADFTFKYDYGNGENADRAVEKGTYILKVTCNNDNYKLAVKNYPITIDPLAVILDMKDFSFQYGIIGEYTPDALGGQRVEISRNQVTVKRVHIAETDKDEDITFRLQAADIQGKYCGKGTYRITNALLSTTQNSPNYEFTLAKPFNVIVSMRVLTVKWKLGTENVPAEQKTVSLSYAGKDVSDKITYTLDGFADEEDVSAVNVNRSITVNGMTATMRNCGKYLITLRLSGSPNYGFYGDTEELTAQITPVALVSVRLGNLEVRRYEDLPNPSVTIDGLMGDDVGKAPNALEGYSFMKETDYNKNTAVQGESNYYVGGTFTFLNYTVDPSAVVRGKVTVIEGYPVYVLSDVTYEYDGTEKRLVILGSLEQGISVNYVNNVQTLVGEYTVTATVTYPSGRTDTLGAKLKIEKATPKINCPDEYGVYTKDLVMNEASIDATAYLNDVIPFVAGTFSMRKNATLYKGKNEIDVTFTPADSRNFKQVSFKKKVTLYEITANALELSHSDYEYDGNGNMWLTKPLDIILDRTGLDGLGNDLALFHNGQAATVITLNRTATETVEIRYGGTSVFTLTLKVTYGEEKEKGEDVVVNHSMLNCVNVVFSENGDKIYLSGTLGSISLDEKYRADYILAVNGEVVVDKFEITPETENITISIRNRKMGASLYYKEIEVSDKKPESKPNGGEINDGGGFKTYYYYIIAGGAALLIVAVILIILKARK